MGGLIQPLKETIIPHSNPDEIEFKFFDGVREELLKTLTKEEIMTAIYKVSKYIADKMGKTLKEFEALLISSKHKENYLAQQLYPFAQTQVEVLEQLGEEYSKFAKEIELGIKLKEFDVNVAKIQIESDNNEIKSNENDTDKFPSPEIFSNLIVEGIPIMSNGEYLPDFDKTPITAKIVKLFLEQYGEKIITKISSNNPNINQINSTRLINNLPPINNAYKRNRENQLLKEVYECVSRIPTFKDYSNTGENYSERTILILALASRSDSRSNFLREIRELKYIIERSLSNEKTKVECKIVGDVGFLRRYLSRIEDSSDSSYIIHFCGHSTGEGLIINNESQQPHFISNEIIVDLLKEFKHKIECVVLNAPETETLAELLAQHLNYVIAMNLEVTDPATIEFSERFYRVLRTEKSIEEQSSIEIAFNMGRDAILDLDLRRNRPRRNRDKAIDDDGYDLSRNEPISDHSIPVLKINPNPTEISFKRGHFSTLRTKFTNSQILIKSLQDLGITVKTDTDVRGRNGIRMRAEVVAVLNGGCDIGFAMNSDGIFDLVTDMRGISKTYNATEPINSIYQQCKLNEAQQQE